MNAKIILVLSLLLFAATCSDEANSNKKFVDTYMNILIARAKYPDSLANARVGEILKSHGYTEASFKEEYLAITKENPQEMMRIIDSIRQKVSADIIKEKKERIRKESENSAEE